MQRDTVSNMSLTPQPIYMRANHAPTHFLDCHNVNFDTAHLDLHAMANTEILQKAGVWGDMIVWNPVNGINLNLLCRSRPEQ